MKTQNLSSKLTNWKYNVGKYREKYSLVQIIQKQLVQISARGSVGVVSIHNNQVWKQLVQISARGSAGVLSTHNNLVWRQRLTKYTESRPIKVYQWR